MSITSNDGKNMEQYTIDTMPTIINENPESSINSSVLHSEPVPCATVLTSLKELDSSLQKMQLKSKATK